MTNGELHATLRLQRSKRQDNQTDFGKGILAPCFVNDLGTVIALGLIFAPFTFRTVVFIAISIAVFALAAKLVPLVPTVRRFNYLGHEGLYYSS